MSDGSVVVCSEDNNSDLFHAIPWSYGTLGFLASVEIDIIPAKRFIQLNYKPTYSQSEMIEVMKYLGSFDRVFRFFEKVNLFLYEMKANHFLINCLF